MRNDIPCYKPSFIFKIIESFKKKLKKEEERFWVKKRVLPAYGVRKPMKEDNLIPI